MTSHRPSRASYLMLALTFLAAALVACSSPTPPPDPAEVTRTFWEALARDDRAALARCAQRSTLTAIDTDALPELALGRTGRMVIDGPEATVATELVFTDAREPVPFLTYLAKQPDGSWLIDAERTLAPIATRSEVTEMVDRMRRLGRNLSRELEQGADELGARLPALGAELGRELERIGEELEKALPEVEKELRRLAEELEDSLRNALPPPPASSPAPPKAEAPEAQNESESESESDDSAPPTQEEAAADPVLI